jgi:hypothetical protein
VFPKYGMSLNAEKSKWDFTVYLISSVMHILYITVQLNI